MQLLFLIFLFGMKSMNNMEVHYLALGDSYTIGESVPETERFPMQLRDSLEKYGIKAGAVDIIARTGWTTNELQDAINKANVRFNHYNLVTLLIGVNNQYRGYPIEQFTREYEALLNQAVAFAGGKPDRVFVLSIPDYGVTPFAAKRNPEKIALEIDTYNRIKKEITEKKGIVYIDITAISRKAADNPDLLASDQLHPSGKMYQNWVEKLLPEVMKLF